jgi:Flp pilus assembly protein TadG
MLTLSDDAGDGGGQLMFGTRAHTGDRRTARRRCSDDRGAALVEFAIIMPLLFLLLFGVIEFAIAFNDYQSIRQGARDGARQAVVTDYGNETSCGINGAATTAPANAQKMICTTKARTGLGNDVRVGVRVTENAPTGYKNDTVKICVVRLVAPVTGLLDPFLEDRPLRTEVEMRVERDLDLGGGDYLETDPSGSWSWC